jgi:hypothetical protein
LDKLRLWLPRHIRRRDCHDLRRIHWKIIVRSSLPLATQLKTLHEEIVKKCRICIGVEKTFRLK